MSDITIKDGTKEEWTYALSQMYKYEKYIIPVGDFDAYQKACGDGHRFLVARNDEGEFVGCITLVVSPGNYAVLDCFFVMPQFRGSGRGKALFQAIVNDTVQKKYNLALHSELAVSSFYLKQGFTIKLDYKILAFNLANFKKIAQDNQHLSILEKPTEVERDDLYDYDKKIWRHSRKHFLSVWLQREDVRVLAVRTSNGVIVGYGVLRKAYPSNSYVLGPLYADNEAFLLPLMQVFLNDIKSTDVIQLRIPSINAQKFQELLQSYASIDFQSEYIPQYMKFVPDLDPKYVYSITDFSTPL